MPEFPAPGTRRESLCRKAGDVFRQGDVPEGQRQEFFPGIAIMENGGFIGGEKPKGFLVIHVNRRGVVFEEQAVVAFGTAQSLLSAFAMRDVAKTPDAANDLRAHPLGAGMILQEPAILEFEQSRFVQFRLVELVPYFFEKLVRIFNWHKIGASV